MTMQTKVHAPARQAQQQKLQQAPQAAAPVFVDQRPEMTQLTAMQAAMTASSHVQGMQTLQAKMAGVVQLQIGTKGKAGDMVSHKDFGFGTIVRKEANGDYVIDWYNNSPQSTIKANDPQCDLDAEEPAPKAAKPKAKSAGQREHEKAQRQIAEQKRLQEEALRQKMTLKRQRGQALWNGEAVRLLGLVDVGVKPLQKDGKWKEDIAKTFSGLKSTLEQGMYPDLATDPELLEKSAERDTEWGAKVWEIVAAKKPKGALPVRMDLWGFLVGTKLNAGEVHYDPDGAAPLHLTVSGNSIAEINTFDPAIFDGSPESIYNALFFKSPIGTRVHVTWQGVAPSERVYVGDVDSLGNKFYQGAWATTPANAVTVANMQAKMSAFKQSMLTKFVELKMRGWVLP